MKRFALFFFLGLWPYMAIPARAADPSFLPDKPVPQTGKVHSENKEFWIEAGALGTAWMMDTVSTAQAFSVNQRRHETGGLFDGSRSVGKIMGAWAAIDVAAVVGSYEWKNHVHNKYLHPLWRVPLIVGSLGHEHAAIGNWTLPSAAGVRDAKPDLSTVAGPPVRQTAPMPVRVPGTIQR